MVIIVVTPVKKEVHTAKGTPILVLLSPVKDSDVTVVTPVTPTPVSESVGQVFLFKTSLCFV